MELFGTMRSHRRVGGPRKLQKGQARMHILAQTHTHRHTKTQILIGGKPSILTCPQRLLQCVFEELKIIKIKCFKMFEHKEDIKKESLGCKKTKNF